MILIKKTAKKFAKLKSLLFFTLIFCSSHLTYSQINSDTFTFSDNNFRFEWNIKKDSAIAFINSNRSVIWQGSLLPSFWVELNRKKIFIPANAVHVSKNNNEARIDFLLGSFGKGSIMISAEQWGIAFHEIKVEWANQVPAIISMYFGAKAIDTKKSLIWPTNDKPFIPTWQSEGFCVPGAKEGTAQSYFRNWDFGQANIALGSFGPSTGTLYAAAFPRPLLYAGMGNDHGFVTLGAGTVPDAAMSLRIQSAMGSFEFVYNEDIWGKPPNKIRSWQEPLRICIAENTWMSFLKYYSSFPKKNHLSKFASMTAWNTWGMWKDHNYVIGPVTSIAKKTNSELMVIDGSWESFTGSGKANKERFPHFEEDIDSIRSSGMAIGLWQSIGWVEFPFEEGLTTKDLILNRNGSPCKANWNFNPSGESYYCLDPSSENARKFIKERTVRIMKTLKPKMLKLDFGYGLPAPFMGVPRNTAFRGEKYSFELMHIIADAAKSIDPDVAIMYYGISPLWLDVTDIISLDDQGDLWYDIKNGHAEWSIWSALLADKNIIINGSSGYDWQSDDEVVLNTCITGAPGSVLSVYDKNHQPIEKKYLNRRLSINNWCRKTSSWAPLWLNSFTGNFSAPPRLNCWGRLERKGDASILTALALREKNDAQINNEQIEKMKWSGRWSLISQDENDIFSSHKLAIIPFDAGFISIPYAARPAHVRQINVEGTTEANCWQWENGILKIEINKELFENVAGFIIE